MSGTNARIEYLKDERTTIYSPATTRPDFLSNIDIDQPSHVVRGIGIICTIGKKLFLCIFFVSLRFCFMIREQLFYSHTQEILTFMLIPCYLHFSE